MKNLISYFEYIESYFFQLVKVFVLAAILCFCTNSLWSQSVPPVKHWEVQHGHSDNIGSDIYADWVFDIIQTSDGGYLAGGFTATSAHERPIPSIVKYNAKGEVEWDRWFDLGDTERFGVINQVIETADNYVAVGNKGVPGVRQIIFVKLDKNGNGTGIPVPIPDATANRGNGIQQTMDGGFIIAGASNGSGDPGYCTGEAPTLGGEDAILLKVNSEGAFEWLKKYGTEFQDGASKVHQYSDGGFIFSGKISPYGDQDDCGDCEGCEDCFDCETCDTESCESDCQDDVVCVFGSSHTKDTDIFIARTDADGLICVGDSDSDTWQISINSKDYPESFYDDFEDDTGPCSPGNLIDVQPGDCIDNGMEQGSQAINACFRASQDEVRDMFFTSDGYILVSGFFNFLRIDKDNNVQNDEWQVACSCDIDGEVKLDEYIDADGVLIKVRPEDGSIDPVDGGFVRNIAHFTGVDLLPQVTEDKTDGNYVVIGTTSNKDLISDESDVNMYLIKTDTNGDRLWSRTFSGPELGSCGFALDATEDGGFIVGGNNAVDGDNYVVVKFYSDCQLNQVYDPLIGIGDTYTVTATETWGDRIIGGHVIIPNGAELILDHATLEFADTRQLNDIADLVSNDPTQIQRAGIRVEPGGRLTIGEDLILKGLEACPENNMWEGIEVWGIASTTDFLQQGQVHVEGNGKTSIQDALVGIRTGETEFDAYGQPTLAINQVGGFVRARHMKFENNLFGVHLLHRPEGESVNVGFQHVSFENYQALADPNFVDEDGSRLGTWRHAYLQTANNINFKTCDFLDTYDHKTVGIYNLWSSADVIEECEFEGLDYGIYAHLTNLWPVNFTVLGIDGEENTFTDNRYGTYVKGTPTSFIYGFNNHFMTTNDADFGLYLDHIGNYVVHDNGFAGNGTNVGVLANNTGHEVTNWVSRNRFGNNAIGLLAHQDNGGTEDDEGLKIRCNNFSFCDYDIYLSSSAETAGSVHFSQGKEDVEPAGNSFTFTTCPSMGLLTHIEGTFSEPGLLDALPFNYYHESAPEATPSCYNSSIVTPEVVTPTDDTFCDEIEGQKQPPEGGGKEGKKSDMVMNKEDTGILQNIHTTLLDNGKNWRQMNESEEEVVRNLAKGHGMEAAKAQTVLTYAFGEEFSIDEPNINRLLKKKISAQEKISSLFTDGFEGELDLGSFSKMEKDCEKPDFYVVEGCEGFETLTKILLDGFLIDPSVATWLNIEWILLEDGFPTGEVIEDQSCVNLPAGTEYIIWITWGDGCNFQIHSDDVVKRRCIDCDVSVRETCTKGGVQLTLVDVLGNPIATGSTANYNVSVIWNYNFTSYPENPFNTVLLPIGDSYQVVFTLTSSDGEIVCTQTLDGVVQGCVCPDNFGFDFGIFEYEIGEDLTFTWNTVGAVSYVVDVAHNYIGCAADNCQFTLPAEAGFNSISLADEGCFFTCQEYNITVTSICVDGTTIQEVIPPYFTIPIFGDCNPCDDGGGSGGGDDTGGTSNKKAIENGTISSNISLYPNPAQSTFNIDFGALVPQAYIQVFDFSGKEVLNREVSRTDDTSIEVNELKAAVYMVKISVEGQAPIFRKLAVVN